jgi:multidrug efflux pump subunit AcrA (membrane-fusion protein)
METQGQRIDSSGRRIEVRAEAQSRTEAQSFDPLGRRLDRAAADAAAQAAAQAAAVAAEEAAAAVPMSLTGSTAHLELRNGGVTFEIEVTVSLETSPFQIIGGTIKSGICGAPWSVTGGSLMGSTLRLDGSRMGSDSCVDTITVVGEFENPNSWRGTYGFDGSSDMFGHVTLFQGWGS